MYTSDPMGVAELVELAGLFVPDIRQSLFDCMQGVFADHQIVNLGFHEPGDHFVIGFPGVRPEFRERLLGLFPDPDGNALHAQV